ALIADAIGIWSAPAGPFGGRNSNPHQEPEGDECSDNVHVESSEAALMLFRNSVCVRIDEREKKLNAVTAAVFSAPSSPVLCTPAGRRGTPPTPSQAARRRFASAAPRRASPSIPPPPSADAVACPPPRHARAPCGQSARGRRSSPRGCVSR